MKTDRTPAPVSSPEPATATAPAAAGSTAPAPSTEAPPASAPADDDTTAALGVVRDYYRAISSHDYATAYAMWGEPGPPNQTPETFAAGFAHTRTVSVTPGQPSRIEGAAGSRYIDIPVTITATTDDGKTQRFEGTYTLRRSVVDGASDAQRRWRFYKATIHERT
ncbi:MAG: hypothetical protein JOZ54_03625 [Acidobacteria bacterium]|nr:hypothetical protein [Acidobacteriota bacterium]